MTVLLISRADGGLSVLVAAVALTDQTAAEEVAKWALCAPPEWLPVAGYRTADHTDLPASRADRDAWADDGRAVAVSPTRKAALDARKAAAQQAEADRIKALIGAK